MLYPLSYGGSRASQDTRTTRPSPLQGVGSHVAAGLCHHRGQAAHHPFDVLRGDPLRPRSQCRRERRWVSQRQTV